MHKTIRAISLYAGLLALVGTSHADDWSQYGGDIRNSRNQAAETTINAANVSSLTPRWILNTGGDVSANPAVVDGYAYVGDWAGNFYKVDVATGALAWGGPKLVSDYTGIPGSFTRNTPAVADGQVIFGDQGGPNVYRCQADGNRRGYRRSELACPATPESDVDFDDLANCARRRDLRGRCKSRRSLCRLHSGLPLLWICRPHGGPRRSDRWHYLGKGHGSRRDFPEMRSGAARRPSTFTGTRSTSRPATITPRRRATTTALKGLATKPSKTVVTRRVITSTAYLRWISTPVRSIGRSGFCRMTPGTSVAHRFSSARRKRSTATTTKVPTSTSANRPFSTTPAPVIPPGTVSVSGRRAAFTGRCDRVTAMSSGALRPDRVVLPADTNGAPRATAMQSTRRMPTAVSSRGHCPMAPARISASSARSIRVMARFFGKLRIPRFFSAGAPATVANGVVYVCSLDANGMMYALDASDGSVQWSQASGGSCGGGATVTDGIVLWGSGYSSIGGAPNNKLWAFSLP